MKLEIPKTSAQGRRVGGADAPGAVAVKSFKK